MQISGHGLLDYLPLYRGFLFSEVGVRSPLVTPGSRAPSAVPGTGVNALGVVAQLLFSGQPFLFHLQILPV